MPVIFVGHGNPMHAILDDEITRTWGRVGKTLPTAQAYVVISAHWQTRGTHITDAPKQPLIYDMYGFPEELYRVTYQANGDPKLAQILQNAFLSYEATLDTTWGLDHGTWSVLRHMAPKPTVPILQISLDMTRSLSQLVDMFTMLKPFREKGVIFIGSGNLVHNLGILNFNSNVAFDWAVEFDAKAAKAITNQDMPRLMNPIRISNTAALAVEFDDHYRPLLAVMALLEKSEQLVYFNETIEMGSVGMRSFISNPIL